MEPDSSRDGIRGIGVAVPAFAPLDRVPAGADVFIDANVLIYALDGTSAQCQSFLERCTKEELTGITLLGVVHDATHRFMLAEAKKKGWITQANAKSLKTRHSVIPQLTEYWNYTKRLLDQGLLLLATNETQTRNAQSHRQRASLLTNDSLIVACMRDYGIRYLATHDKDFERVPEIQVFGPTDV